jgi:hypothetical protein
MTQEVLEKALALQKEITELKEALEIINPSSKEENILLAKDSVISIVITAKHYGDYYSNSSSNNNNYKLELNKNFTNSVISFLIEKIEVRLLELEKELLEL